MSASHAASFQVVRADGTRLRVLGILVFVTAACVGTPRLLSAQTPDPSTTARYRVDVSPSANGPPDLQVQVRLPPATSEISFPGPSVGTDPGEWNDEWVDALNARDGADRPVPLRLLGPGRWSLEADPDGEITVSYAVNLDLALTSWPAGNEHAAYWEDHALYAVGEALFATSDAAEEARVTFSLPEGWRASTPWMAQSRESATFVVATEEDLLDNAVVLGTHAAVSHEVNGFRYELALIGRAAGVREEALPLARKLVETYAELFGGAPPGAYLQAMFVSDAEDGEAYRSSSGFRTSLVPDERNLLLWGNQLAHELFHRWIASDAAIAAETYAHGQWLSEGLAEYYANLTLLRTGAIDLDAWLSKLEKHVGLYLFYRSASAFQSSLKEAGTDKRRERLAVYNGGWTAAFCLDVQARREGTAATGLDAFLRGLWEEFGSTGRTYTFDDLPRVYRESTGVDADEVFARYIAGTETFPLERCLRDAALEAGIKGYAAEVWAWPLNEPTAAQSRVLEGLTR